MLKQDKIEKLLSIKQKVFSIEDLATFWQEQDYDKIQELSRYYTNENRLFRVKSGLYSTSTHPDILEIAQKLQRPSYITFHTALSIHGINFQYYSDIHCFAGRKKAIQVLNQKIIYHQVKPEILFNPIGIISENNYNLASPERALCDSLYISPAISFDNLHNIDTKKLFAIAQIYSNKRLIKDLQKLF